jgi:hypothetical protein
VVAGFPAASFGFGAVAADDDDDAAGYPELPWARAACYGI